MEYNLDVCALTETWIREVDDTTAIQLWPDGYSSVSIPREEELGRHCNCAQVWYNFKEQVSL